MSTAFRIAAAVAAIVVSGVETPCADTGSCAAYEAAVTVVDSTPDFATSDHANHVAAAIADGMQAAIGHRPSFDELRIVPDGVEIVLRTIAFDRETASAQRAFEAARAAMPAGDRAAAAGAHLHTRFVLHGAAALERLTMRIAHDRAWQEAHGIELSTWFPDSTTDSVHIELLHYRDAVAVLLVERYGTVTVSTKDTPYAQAL